jgi:hypothetical protein
MDDPGERVLGQVILLAVRRSSVQAGRYVGERRSSAPQNVSEEIRDHLSSNMNAIMPIVYIHVVAAVFRISVQLLSP